MEVHTLEKYNYHSLKQRVAWNDWNNFDLYWIVFFLLYGFEMIILAEYAYLNLFILLINDLYEQLFRVNIVFFLYAFV